MPVPDIAHPPSLHRVLLTQRTGRVQAFRFGSPSIRAAEGTSFECTIDVSARCSHIASSTTGLSVSYRIESKSRCPCDAIRCDETSPHAQRRVVSVASHSPAFFPPLPHSLTPSLTPSSSLLHVAKLSNPEKSENSKPPLPTRKIYSLPLPIRNRRHAHTHAVRAHLFKTAPPSGSAELKGGVCAELCRVVRVLREVWAGWGA